MTAQHVVRIGPAVLCGDDVGVARRGPAPPRLRTPVDNVVLNLTGQTLMALVVDEHNHPVGMLIVAGRARVARGLGVRSGDVGDVCRAA